MRTSNFLNWVERLAAFQRQMAEANHAADARAWAHDLEDSMEDAKPSGALGDGRLGNLDDCAAAGMLNSKGLFIGAFGEHGRFLFHNGDESLLTYNRAGGGKAWRTDAVALWFEADEVGPARCPQHRMPQVR